MTSLLILWLCTKSASIDFAKQVQPVLEAHCQPCHFPGGKMYAKLPFDRPETVVRLGTTRMFTRIHDEQQRDLIRQFIAQEGKQ